MKLSQATQSNRFINGRLACPSSMQAGSTITSQLSAMGIFLQHSWLAACLDHLRRTAQPNPTHQSDAALLEALLGQVLTTDFALCGEGHLPADILVRCHTAHSTQSTRAPEHVFDRAQKLRPFCFYTVTSLCPADLARKTAARQACAASG